ncbi:acetyltransferase [Thermodesulfitimonas autotrophica]|uniref:Acetyltransferase n=1 Tax=Thermodesulfitimonas autotrophica TaxID=1894989 RepID=A0A3N5ANN4_9THEO|nr:acetate--CoA ligase [Thermodesulfitimonas autotrophica]RPF46553.1 acetyltransferase [Thermodesulfitimonas autotrophica]
MRALDVIFRPQSIAVVGASKNREKLGNVILRNIIGSGYRGVVFPVNPKETEIEGLKAYPAVSAIGQAVDLAVVVVPAERALDVTRDCGKAGVKGLVVISAGFKEVGKEGLAREKELVEICRAHDMLLLGPNCVGIMDTHTPLNASFAAGFPLRGEIAFISQSGAMLVAILDWSVKTGLGFSRFVSMGNKADLNEADFIADAVSDPNTKVILCYIEDVKDGEHFLRVADEATRYKPVIVLKSGTSQAGAQAASSHTGALAGSDLAYETAFKQTGIIRVRTMSELFDLAVVFTRQPVPRGRRVAVVTNAGGPGIVTTDSIEAGGLDMARFNRETIESLRGELPAEANVFNPVDVLGDARTERFRFAMEKVLSDENVDSAVVLLCPTAVAEPVETAEAILAVKEKYPQKPVLAVYMGGESLAPGAELLTERGIPCFTFPELAVRALGGLVNYGRIKERPAKEELPVYPDVNPEVVRRVFSRVREDRRRTLLGSEAMEVAAAYGIPVAPVKLARRAAEAVTHAAELGYPVVLKVASPDIIHKTDVGGVRVGLQTPEEIREAFWEIMERVHEHLPRALVYGVDVQKMYPKGTELIVGVTRDIQFGPLIAFGLGGIYVNLLKDVAFRLVWGMGEQQVEEMIKETKAYTLLRGYRGEKPRDIGALVNVISRVGRLVSDFPEIVEMDINPVFAYEQGAVALDVKITIG